MPVLIGERNKMFQLFILKQFFGACHLYTWNECKCSSSKSSHCNACDYCKNQAYNTQRYSAGFFIQCRSRFLKDFNSVKCYCVHSAELIHDKVCGKNAEWFQCCWAKNGRYYVSPRWSPIIELEKRFVRPKLIHRHHFGSCQLLGHLVFLYEKFNLTKIKFFWSSFIFFFFKITKCPISWQFHIHFQKTFTVHWPLPC